MSMISSLLRILRSIRSNPEFLTDVAALAGVIAAIAMPLGSSLINSLGERYGSSAISATFRREWSYRTIWLWVLVLPLSLITRFAIPDTPTPGLWSTLLWALLALSLCMVLGLAWFLKTILRYAADTSGVVTGKLMERLRGNITWGFRRHVATRWLHNLVFKRFRKPLTAQEIERLLSGLNSVAVYEAQRMRTQSVESMLKDVETLCREVIAHDTGAPIARDVVATWAGQLDYLLRSADDVGNTQVEEEAASALATLVHVASQHPGWNGFVGSTIYRMQSLVADCRSLSRQGCESLLIGWATPLWSSISSCRPEYIDVLANGLFDSLRFIVSNPSEDHDQIFQNWVQYVSDQHGSLDISSDLNRYGTVCIRHDGAATQRIHAVQGDIETLRDQARFAATGDDLCEWLSSFKALTERIAPGDDPAITDAAQEVRKAIDSLVRFNAYVGAAFKVGAYCLFKGRPELIRAMWDYRSPRDADAIWVARDLAFENPNSLTAFYFHTQLWDESIWLEGHHGSSQYVKEYYLLRLAWLLRPYASKVAEARTDGQPIPPSPNGDLHLLSYDRLHAVRHAVEDLIERTSELEQNGELHEQLGFGTSDVSAIYADGVVPFLNGLVSHAQQHMRTFLAELSIPPERIAVFRQHVLQAYREYRRISALYETEYFGERAVQLNPVQSQTVFDRTLQPCLLSKESFLAEWESDLELRARHFGESIASDENTQIIEFLIGRSRRLDNASNIRDVLDEFEDKTALTIFASFEVIRDQVGDLRPASVVDATALGLAPGRAEGIYDCDGVAIPVFSFQEMYGRGAILVLDRRTAGRFVHRSPADEPEDPSIVEHLVVQVIPLSDDEEALTGCVEQTFTHQPGRDRSDVELELRGQVLIRVRQKFVIAIDDLSAISWFPAANVGKPGSQ